MAKIQEGRAKGWEKWTFLWQVLSSGRRSACRGFPTLRHGCHQRLRVRVLKTDFSLFVDGDISILVILQVVHLCVQSRPGDGGEHSLAALWAFWGGPERQGEKSVVFLIVLNWPCLIRWSETCRRTSARALASSPWPTTRRLLSPFRWEKKIKFCFFCQFLQFYHNLYRVLLLDI